MTGIPKSREIGVDDVREALSDSINAIVQAVHLTLEKTPPELSADIADRGVVLVGGGALLRNLDVLLREIVGVPITIANDPISAVVMGAGQVLNDMELLKKATVSF